MRTTFLAISAIVASAVALGFVFRESIDEQLNAWATQDMYVQADVANYDTGPELGTRLPDLEFEHMGSRLNVFERFTRGSGLVLLALPSLNSCIYSVKQIIQLQQIKHRFQRVGIKLVAITFDPQDVQQAFADKHALTIPLLPDEQSQSFRTLGIINDTYQPGDSEFGSPHPGFIVINRQGKVVGKLFVKDPDLRVESTDVLRYAKRTLGLKDLFQEG